MSTLVLRLEGPLQSWGTSLSKQAHRDTALMPTKSGVIGLIANAMGRDRSESVADLAAGRFAVRTERPGVVLSDYHTGRSTELIVHQRRVKGPKAKVGAEKTLLSTRLYLHDAAFIACLELEDDLAAKVVKSLRHPARQLFLGRRGCPPTGPVLVGIVLESMEEALQVWGGSVKGRWSMDSSFDDPSAQIDDDVPISFDSGHRKHSRRAVLTGGHVEPVIQHHDPFDF